MLFRFFSFSTKNLILDVSYVERKNLTGRLMLVSPIQSLKASYREEIHCFVLLLFLNMTLYILSTYRSIMNAVYVHRLYTSIFECWYIRVFVILRKYFRYLSQIFSRFRYDLKLDRKNYFLKSQFHLCTQWLIMFYFNCS